MDKIQAGLDAVKKMVVKFIKKTIWFWAISGAVALLIVSQRGLWITKELMFTHDSLRWYGIFSFFFDSLHNRLFPLWNPYMNCGEPFFLNIDIMRLWDPLTLLLAGLSKLIRLDFLTAYHYDPFLKYLIFICGAYLFFAYTSKFKISAFIAFLALAFSSLSSSYLRQHSFLLVIYTLPWILLFIMRVLDTKNRNDFFALMIFLGLTIPAYNSLHLLIFVLIFAIGLFVSRIRTMFDLLGFLKNYRVVLAGLLLLAFLTMRMAPQALYFKDIIPTLRIEEVRSSAYCKIPDFLLLASPYYFTAYFNDPAKNIMSEAFLYIGLLPMMLLVVGVFLSRHKLKFAFLFTLLATAILMLGDKTPLFGVFNKLFPFFWLLRNLHGFSPFLLFSLSFFVCIGFDSLTSLIYDGRAGRCGICILIAAILVSYLVIVVVRQLNAVTDIYNIGPIPEKQSLDTLLLFAIGCVLILLALRIKKARKILMPSVLILFMLADLLLFQHSLMAYTASPRPKDSLGLPLYATRPIYEDKRMLEGPQGPSSLAFLPAIFKKSAAHDRASVFGTHFFETSHYYDMWRTPMNSGVKEILCGVSHPKLRLMEHVSIANAHEISSKLSSIDEKTALNTVFLETDLPSEYRHLLLPAEKNKNASYGLGEIKVKYFDYNNLLLDVRAEKDCILYYADGYDKHWKVTIDDKNDTLYKANMAFKALLVPAGNHRVQFFYDPKFYKTSLRFYLLSLCSILLVGLFLMIRKFTRVFRKT